MTRDEVAERYCLSKRERADLDAFDRLFTETAAHTNLVSRATLPDRWARHYADSLQLWPLVPEGAKTLLDVGAGGGFPGIPLAILARERCPDLRLTLIDSVGKKTRFLAEAAHEIGLANVEVVNARVETLPGPYDVITARAVTALPRLLDLCTPRLAPGGTLILPKGARAEEELRDARRDWRLETNRVDSGTDADATILVITKPERLR